MKQQNPKGVTKFGFFGNISYNAFLQNSPSKNPATPTFETALFLNIWLLNCSYLRSAHPMWHALRYFESLYRPQYGNTAINDIRSNWTAFLNPVSFCIFRWEIKNFSSQDSFFTYSLHIHNIENFAILRRPSSISFFLSS